MNQEVIIPIIYEENKVKVLNDLKEGRLDYLDLADWSFQDKFFAFLLSTRFFEICGASYPSPRKKEEVMIWFLLVCQVTMKLHTTSAYSKLPGILRSGAILSRVKFNVGGKNYTLKIIEDNDLMALTQKPFHDNASDISGSAGNQNIHPEVPSLTGWR